MENNLNKSIYISFLVVLTISLLFINQPSLSKSGNLSTEIGFFAKSLISEHSAQGVSLAIRYKEQKIITTAHGLANIENDVEASDNTIYRIGSLTKQFTSAAILLLVEQGKLSLNDEVSKYIDIPPYKGDQIKVINLLNHTSGIPNYSDFEHTYREKIRLDLSNAEMLDIFLSPSFDFRPGEDWAYSNSGYYLLGLIIEQVSGLSYKKFLETMFFKPLNLSQTTYCDQQKIIKKRASGYSIHNGDYINARPISMQIPFSAGGLCSSVVDLIKWNKALVSGQAITKASYAKMIEPTVIDGDKIKPYGLGLWTMHNDGIKKVFHGGQINGFIAYLAYYPTEDLTIAILANGDHQSVHEIGQMLADKILLE